jgi:hypothetical protein
MRRYQPMPWLPSDAPMPVAVRQGAAERRGQSVRAARNGVWPVGWPQSPTRRRIEAAPTRERLIGQHSRAPQALVHIVMPPP